MFKRFWWVFLVTLVLGPFLGLFIGGITAYVAPKRYESTVVLQVRPVSTLGDPASPSATPSTFFATEFEVIRSQATLDRVIDQLDLANRWGMPRVEALENLRRSIEAKNIEGTDLIEIRVRTASPNDSKIIAKTVSEAYRGRRREIESSRSDRALEELRNAVREQEDRVEEKRKVLTQLIRSGVIYDGSHSSNAARKNAALETEKIKLEGQIDTLLRYDGEQLITYAAGLNLPENIVRSLHPQWLEAQRQLKATKQAGLGDSHPSVKQQENIVEGLSKDLEEGVVALRETLRAQLELVEEQAERLRIKKEADQSKKSFPGIARVNFDDAKADFESAQSLLERLKIKLISQEMAKRISEDPIIIHSPAVESNSPASPNIPLTLFLGAAGGLALGFVAPFLIIPLLHSMTKPEPA